MELIRGIHNIRSKHRRGVLTIGNFDGVHLGHQAILSRVKTLAKEYQSPAGVMIFEPQPREFFAPDSAPGRITRMRDKVAMLKAQGIDYVLCLPFNNKLRNLDASEFCNLILKEGLHIRHLVVGDDFRFGCDRQGDFGYLSRFGELSDFKVENTSSVLSQNNERISSTLVRQQLESGHLSQATTSMGHPMIMSGRVIGGKQLGRTIGFPTANIHLKGCEPAVRGVYAVTLTLDGVAHQGVANVGVRPTVDGKHPLLEVHVFNFDGDLYHKYVSVEFNYFIRPERKMSGLEELEKQIQCDKEEAQRFFSNL